MKRCGHATRFSLPAVAGVLALLLQAGAEAQDARLNLIGAYREAFSAGPVGGTRSTRTVDTLVGVRIGSPDRLFEPGALRVALGQSATQGPLCLRLIARDGRYSASATYQTSAAQGFPLIEAPTRYGDALKAYRATDIAVAAFVAAGCDIGKASELFAVLHSQPRNGDMLVVQVNSSASRVRAQLAKTGKAAGALTSCGSAEGGPRVGFSTECRLSLEDAEPGGYRLTVVETTTSGATQSRTYPLRLIRIGS